MKSPLLQSSEVQIQIQLYCRAIIASERLESQEGPYTVISPRMRIEPMLHALQVDCSNQSATMTQSMQVKSAEITMSVAKTRFES